MLVSCPTCSARYQMNPNFIDPDHGRVVRCSSCSHSWRIYRSAQEEGSNPDSSNLHQVKADGDVNARKEKINNKKKLHKSGKRSLLAPLVGINFFIFLFLSLGYFFRTDIVKIVPQTERLYEVLGIEVKTTGISLVMPYLEKMIHDDGHISLLIQGSFLNSHPKQVLPIPPLRVVLFNEDNIAITYFIKSDFNPATLPPGGVSGFTFEIKDLPKEAVDVFLEFEVAKSSKF